MNKDELIEYLLGEVRRLKSKPPSSSKIKISKFSNETSFDEREALRKHIQDLDNKKKTKPVITNTFKLGQIVDLKDNASYIHGVIAFIACKQAIPSIRQCNPKSCSHPEKTYVWVEWKNKKLIAYYHTKLSLVNPEDLKPRIGRELSGKIGPWEFNAETGRWKKDGKEYSKEEFADIMYWEMHPYAKEEAEEFIKRLKFQ